MTGAHALVERAAGLLGHWLVLPLLLALVIGAWLIVDDAVRRWRRARAWRAWRPDR